MNRTWCRPLFAPLLVVAGINAPSSADIWTAQIFDDQVQRLEDETGAVLSGGIASGLGLDEPAGMALGPDGNLYVGNQGGAAVGQILRFDLGGTPLGLFATMPPNGEFPGVPGRMRFGPNGHLYVADFGGPNVREFDAGGNYVGDAATVGVNVGGLTFGPDGALYVADFSAANIIRVVGGMQEEFVAPSSGGLANPGGLFFLPSGEFLVTDLFNNRILKYDENGDNPEVWTEIPPEISPNPEDWPPGAFVASHFPSDFVFDPAGNIVLGVLGQTNPDAGGADKGALLRYGLEGNLLERIADNLPPVSDLLWLPAPDAVQGDYDGDGSVLESDYVMWRADFGKMVAAGGGADGNGDGVVDAADYTVWRDAMESMSMGAGSAVVPEPPASLLAIVAALPVLAFRKVRPMPTAKLLWSPFLSEA